MASNYKNPSNVDFDSLFDPDVVGDGPTAATFKKSDGTLLKYADISYGSKGPDVGYKLSSGTDVSTLWAAAGTAQYPLPIDGQTFLGQKTVASGTGSANINFSSTTTTWTITGSTNAGPVTLATGPVPTGATKVKYSNGSPTTSSTLAGGSVTNTASGITNLSSNPVWSYTTANFGSLSGTHDSNYPVTIQFYNSSSALISTTHIFLVGQVEGSV